MPPLELAVAIDVDERTQPPMIAPAAAPTARGVDVDVVALAAELAQALTTSGTLPIRPGAGARAGELLGEVAARAAASRPGARTQAEYAAIYTRFTTWLAGQLGRPATVADLDERALLAYRDHRARTGGRDGTGAATATLRKELAALRILARKAGRPDLACELELPVHEPPPPATLTVEEYERALRMPDRRTRAGRRDHAVLAVLGDTGIRNAELRALRGRDLVRRRRDSPVRSLRIHGKGGVGRTLKLTQAADRALDDWLAVHPLAHRTGDRAVLPGDAPLFVSLGRHGHGRALGRPLSTSALEDLVGKHLAAAGVDPELAHPHALRAYHLTRLAQLGVPDHTIRDRSGHRDVRVLHRHYLALVDADREQLVDVLDEADRRR